MKHIYAGIILIPLLLFLTGCNVGYDPDRPRETAAERSTAAPFEPAADGSNYREPAVRNLSEDELKEAAAQ
ncbi:MAG: hypothetical protein II800_07485, partial [Lachnospiraceae bacterium]|nr:hypothetical protein [Lachnospiraceae bacterium]